MIWHIDSLIHFEFFSPFWKRRSKIGFWWNLWAKIFLKKNFSLEEKPICSKVIEFGGISIIFNVNFLKFLKTYEVGPAPTKSATVPQGFPHGGASGGGYWGLNFWAPPLKFLAPPWPPHLEKHWPPHQKFDGGAGGLVRGPRKNEKQKIKKLIF